MAYEEFNTEFRSSKRARPSSEKAPGAKTQCRDASKGVKRAVQRRSIGTPMNLLALSNLYYKKASAYSSSVKLIQEGVSKLRDNFLNTTEAVDLFVKAQRASSDCAQSNQLLNTSIELLQNADIEDDLDEVFGSILAAGQMALDCSAFLSRLEINSNTVLEKMFNSVT